MQMIDEELEGLGDYGMSGPSPEIDLTPAKREIADGCSGEG